MFEMATGIFAREDNAMDGEEISMDINEGVVSTSVDIGDNTERSHDGELRK